MQSVTTRFDQLAQGGVRPHRVGLWMSFDKSYDDNVEFGMWDSSLWDGGDLWKPTEDNPIQQWDYYDYKNYSDRIVDMEWTRAIEFPYSVQSAIADFTVNNYDDYLTPGNGSPIADYILPKRPLRLYSGFREAGTIQQFVGVTQGMPIIDSDSMTAQFMAYDFLSEMFSLPLSEVVAMSNVTTDEVLIEIFTQFGLSPSSYSLAKGRNRIPFVFFPRDKNAGNAFRELMQAEGGALWLDEQGIIRFEPRIIIGDDPVMEFNDTNVDYISTSDDSEIINTVRVTTNVREVKDLQPVFLSVDPETGQSTFIDPIIIPASGSRFVTVDLSDPLLSVNTPTIGQKNDSWFSALNGTTPVGSNVSVTLETLNNNNYTMLFNNTNGFPVEIDRLTVWGEPAKIVDVLKEEYYDEDSVEKYGNIVLGGDEGIINDLFGSASNIESFALTIIDAYKDFAGVIEMSVKSHPALQLGDVITVDTRKVSGTYKIIKITNSYQNSRASQIIKARKYEPRNWAFWDISLWDGGDLWSP